MSQVSWNFGDLLEGIEAPLLLPGEAPVLIHEDRSVSWPDYARRSNNFAAGLLARDARPVDKVACYMRNRPEYLEVLGAAFKARLVHANKIPGKGAAIGATAGAGPDVRQSCRSSNRRRPRLSRRRPRWNKRKPPTRHNALSTTRRRRLVSRDVGTL
jgi:hypothetical protein